MQGYKLILWNLEQKLGFMLILKYFLIKGMLNKQVNNAASKKFQILLRYDDKF